ncbi:MAG: hypothetical protein QOK05_874 [Chloroflexota bacterium]|nr:hypothetical protein [Chloroflexota bacterium]
MMLPRLRLLARLAGERDTLNDAVTLAELREDYRYLASVCRNVLPHLEDDLGELPEPLPEFAPRELKVAYQMSLMRRTNRLHRAVQAAVDNRSGTIRRSAATD